MVLATTQHQVQRKSKNLCKTIVKLPARCGQNLGLSQQLSLWGEKCWLAALEAKVSLSLLVLRLPVVLRAAMAAPIFPDPDCLWFELLLINQQFIDMKVESAYKIRLAWATLTWGCVLNCWIGSTSSYPITVDMWHE
jgi:hypothetical protein